MHIDEAIKQLKEAKKQGRKHIILAWWDAAMFERQDDDLWAHDSEYVDCQMDWSPTHDDINALLAKGGE